MAHSISRRTLVLTGAALTVSPLLAACTPRESLTSLRMACGEPGGTYIRFGELLSEVATRRGIVNQLEILESEGSVDNVRLLVSGEADVAISLMDTAASEGASLFALGRVYQNYLQCIVTVESGLTEAAELEGKRVSIGAASSGTAKTSRRALGALGLAGPSGGAELVERRLADAVTQLGTGEIDALMWSGGIPLPELERLTDTVPTTLLDLSAAIPTLNAQFGSVYQYTVIPAGVYSLAEPTPAIGVSNVLLVRGDLPDPTVRGLVSILIEDAPSLVPEPSRGLQYLTPTTLIGTYPIPLHPAAAREYAAHYN